MIKGTGIRAAALIVLIAMIAAPASAKDRGDDLSFLDGLSLIVLSTDDIQSMHSARQLVQSHGGVVAIMSPPSVMIGWIPDGQRDRLAIESGIASIHSEEVSPAALSIRDEKQLSMVHFFNRAVSGDIKEERRRFMQTASRPDEGGHAPDGDVYDPPPIEKEAYLDNLRNVGVDMELAEANGQIVTSPGAVMGNSDAMSGVTALTIFFIESDGSSTDPDLYTWTPEDMQNYLDGVATGLMFWSEQALFNGCSKTWLINYKSGADPDCQQWTEPILHPSSWQGTWITEIMNNMGYTSGGYFTKVTSFNTWQRTHYGTDRSYSAFVPYNPAGPAMFSDGATAYAYLGGPFTVLLFKVNGWMTSEVYTHETGHIYGNCDEYLGGCSSCTATCGFVTPTANGNCEACNPNSRGCMMRENVFSLCTYSPGQLGWLANPCDPPAPPVLPQPTLANISPADGLQGLGDQFTITGTNFAAGMKVEIGGEVFVDIYDLQDSQTMVIDARVLNDAPLGFYDVKIENKDGKFATLSSSFEVLPTTKHYYSPTGGNNFPYLTPADAATDLFEAINTSYDGDTLFMPTGAFNNMDLILDRGVLLHGAWDPTFTTRNLATGKTVIDINFGITITPGVFGGGFDGFELTGGLGNPDVFPYIGNFGGALRVVSGSLLLSNCEVHLNAASTGGNYGVGGGIFGYQSTIDINNCDFHDNDATQGGGIYLEQCSGTVDNNTFTSNTVSIGPEDHMGGAVMLVGCTNLTLSDNTMTGHTTALNGGALAIENSTNVLISGGAINNNAAEDNGGAALLDGGQVTFDGVTMTNNSVTDLTGGAISTVNAVDLTLTENVFRANTALLGGALYLVGGITNITHNLFDGNNGSAAAGAMSVSSPTAGAIVGNTLYGNMSASTGGMSVSSTSIEIKNNIFSNTTGTALACGGSPLPVNTYNLMWNNTTDYSGCSAGTGAVSGDPLFVNAAGGDFHLGLHSPAIDAGDPAPADNDPDGSRGDIGVYGSHSFTMDQPSYPKNLSADVQLGDVVLTWDANAEGDIANYAIYCDSLSGFVPSAGNFVTLVAAGTETANLGAAADSAFYLISVVDNDGYASGYSNEDGYANTPTGIGDPIARRNRLGQNRPNPFNPVTTISYELDTRSDVTLDIYDVDGRLVRTLVRESKSPGTYAVEWNGLNGQGSPVASGIYFYRLRAGQFVETRKMVLLK